MRQQGEGQWRTKTVAMHPYNIEVCFAISCNFLSSASVGTREVAERWVGGGEVRVMGGWEMVVGVVMGRS